MSTYDLGRVVGDTGPVGPTGPTGPEGPVCARVWVTNATYITEDPIYSGGTFSVPASSILDFYNDLELYDYIWFTRFGVFCYVSAFNSGSVNCYCPFSVGDAKRFLPVGGTGSNNPNLAVGATGTYSVSTDYGVEANSLVFNVDSGRIMKVDSRTKPTWGSAQLPLTGVFDLGSFATRQYVDDTIQALDLSQVSF